MPLKAPRRSRGFSLIEVMVSAAILAIGVLGVAQLQVLASAQNGVARRTARAASVLRDFTEAATRWSWSDPRLQPNGGCAAYSTAMQLTPGALGAARAPGVVFQYTALPDTTPDVAQIGTTAGALTLGGMPYPGNAEGVLAELAAADYQLGWTVWQLDGNGNLTDGCESRLVNVAVRFRIANTNQYKNLVTEFIQYNSSSLFPPSVMPDGLPEQF